ncbi:MAG: 4-hydroxythreonine-4-phosphate dehydrogenase PdxA [Nitrospinae bacterium]|nr:4-hydroxythreonine-4-phosphate dehydrogenase PdxA [Nitrospinota bacterium]
MKRRPVIAMTMGDPAGVGPEVCLKAALEASVQKKCVSLIVGDMAVLRKHARRMKIPARLRRVKDESKLLEYGESTTTPVLDLENVAPEHRVYGKVLPELGAAAGQYIEKAVSMAREGLVDAIATAPINKESLQAGGYDYPGHTEMLADLCGGGRPVMMLAHRKIRIAHISTHCPLRVALRRVKRKRIVYVASVLEDALRRLDRKKPRIGLAGLNPHAGEAGLFGREEVEEIAPAVADLREMGIDAHGPEPPDTIFGKLRGGYYSGVVAMYHDQGHIPGKLMCFRFDSRGQASVRGVNVTLGLPIIRTSVEHGTGFPIAGQGIADPSSMVDALILAAKLAGNG